MDGICNKKMTFQDCELAILRAAVDKAEERQGRNVVNSPEIKRIINIVETFLKTKQVICYGGIAINNILPKNAQFYNKSSEIPDYDFFSPTALETAKELADLYYSKGYSEVEAKSGMHMGTYKVFVNYIPVADITLLPKPIYNALKKDAIRVGGILYTPPNYLRMSMYLELSRPAGDTSRWEKVLKRLLLLNNNYPITNLKCNNVNFQREMDDKMIEQNIFKTLKNTLINQGVVFFGGFANTLYSHYMPKNLKKYVGNIFDLGHQKKLLNAKLIFIDTAHNGDFEYKVIKYLIDNNYKGIVILDDIYWNGKMFYFWQAIKIKKTDLTLIGHGDGSGPNGNISGTGLIDFSNELIINFDGVEIKLKKKIKIIYIKIKYFFKSLFIKNKFIY